MNKLKISIILMTLSLTSCELIDEINFDPYYDGGKINVHGLISYNEGIKVQVTKTVPVNDTGNDDFIPGAKVILYANNIPICDLIESDSSYFISPDSLSLEEGVAYKIKVVTQNNGEAESGVQYLMPQVEIDSLICKKDTITWRGEKILYMFSDPAGVNNSYSFYYYILHDDSMIYSSKTERYFNLNYFDDGLFRGDKVWKDEGFTSYFIKYDTIQIVGRLFNISEELKRFLESLDEYEYTRENPFFDYTTPVYTNIRNGYGIFGSYSFHERQITYIKSR